MIASSSEERGHLEASSNDGLEGEQTYQADYSIVYRSGKQDQVLLKLPAFLFVRPSDQVLEFDKFSFKNAEVYLLAPQYKSGHGLVAYAFAVNKISGEVFPLSFKQGEIVHDTLVYSELPPFPANQNEQLVVHSPEGAGGDPEPEATGIRFRSGEAAVYRALEVIYTNIQFPVLSYRDSPYRKTP